MNLKPSNATVKSSLNGHTWLGLTLSALMYLICLSGTVVVFFEEFERWEQPLIEEYDNYSPKQLQIAIEQFLNRVEKIPKSLYLVLPTKAVPRIHISGDGQEWFVNQDGSLNESPVEGWTHMLKELHVQLHLPQTLGIIIVGSLGAMLCGLIISGLLAHPRIFKDAFKLRLGGGKRLEQADIHNRLGVWGTPFYFMIGLTGAYIGLVGVLIAVSAPLFYNGDRDAVVDVVYGADPSVQRPREDINFTQIFTNLEKKESTAEPIYLVIQNINSEEQFVEVAATLPGRLIYSEMYRFHSNGDLINHQGLSDGPAGRQVAYSVYRLHFGHFGSGWVKILYGFLGLALTVISASGMNIWLARRKHRSFVNDAWAAVVWGTPLALTISALLNHFGFSSFLSFWLLLVSSMAFSLYLKNEKRVRAIFIRLILFSSLIIVYLYYFKFGSLSINAAAMKINVAILTSILGYLVWCGVRISLKLIENRQLKTLL